MSLSEREIRTIVDRITAELDRGGRAAPSSARPAPASPRPRPSGGSLGIYETVDEAVAAARQAQQEGVADKRSPEELETRIDQTMWTPEYTWP